MPKHIPESPWSRNPTAEAELKKLWENGTVASGCAEILSTMFQDNFTKNAIIGKAHRMGLSERPSILPKNFVRQPPKPDIPPHRKCQWPYGDPKEKGFRFCGQKTILGRSYCAEHDLEAYVKIKVRASS